MSHRLVLAAASPNFLRKIFDDLDLDGGGSGGQTCCTLLCPDVTVSEMARVLCLVYRGEAVLESTVDATKYHNCLKLITCLGIPIEDFVVGTRNTVKGGMASRNPVDQHQVIRTRIMITAGQIYSPRGRVYFTQSDSKELSAYYRGPHNYGVRDILLTIVMCPFFSQMCMDSKTLGAPDSQNAWSCKCVC